MNDKHEEIYLKLLELLQKKVPDRIELYEDSSMIVVNAENNEESGV